MSIKYCYNHEIHKTLHIPPDYPSLLTDISSLFVQKLPLTFYLQYHDSDGDKIAIANDQEFQALVKQELTDPTSCIKLFITDLNNAPHMSHQRSTCTPRSNSNGSFEVVESENSLRMEEITDAVLPNDSEEDDLESKVVVSLQIPQTNTILKNETKSSEDNEQEEPSFSCSATGKSRTSESRDLVQEMSLSMVEEGSVADGESCASNPAFNQAFQTEEENLSLSEEEESIPRENPKKNMNIKEVVQGNMRTVTLEIPDFREKDSRDLSEYLSRIIKRKSGEQASVKLDKILCSGTSEAPEEEDDENNKSKEESPERWVSFDSQHDETPTAVELPQQRRNLFTLKQRPETWFMCNQDRSNRYREEQEGEGELSDSMAAARKSPNKMRYEEELVDKMMMKDEEAGMYYQELKTKKVKSEQPSAEISFKENQDDLLHDIWYDLQHSIKIQSDKAQQFSFEDYYERKSQAQGGEQESPREVVETMNMSLLTASEAKRIASAIGSINRIDGVKKLRIFPEPNSPVEKVDNKKAPSPLYNRWACRRSDIKLPGEEDWPFLGQCETAGKKEVCNFTENKVHEGSFCMGCWQSPIRGPRYVCLICDDIEYCEACEGKINHCHPLLKVKEPVGSLQDFMENMRTKFVQKSEPVFTPRGELSFKEESVYKDMDTMEKGECEEDDEYRSKEEMRDEYKFDFKEISSTPLMIKSNQKEWCVVYKTICLKNTGTSMWRRCHFEPVGLVPGTITEVSYVSPGDSVLVTLEIHGFFAPGKYNSTWRVVHQGDLNVLSEMGYIDLEFDVVENRSNLFGGHLQTYQFCDY